MGALPRSVAFRSYGSTEKAVALMAVRGRTSDSERGDGSCGAEGRVQVVWPRPRARECQPLVRAGSGDGHRGAERLGQVDPAFDCGNARTPDTWPDRLRLTRRHEGGGPRSAWLARARSARVRGSEWKG